VIVVARSFFNKYSRNFLNRQTLSREPALPPTFRRNQRFGQLWPSLLPLRLQFVTSESAAGGGEDLLLVPPRAAFQCLAPVGTNSNAQLEAQPLGVASRAQSSGVGCGGPQSDFKTGRLPPGRRSNLVEWGTTVEHTEWGVCAGHARLQLSDNDD
jgi:hypothetical protein